MRPTSATSTSFVSSCLPLSWHACLPLTSTALPLLFSSLPSDPSDSTPPVSSPPSHPPTTTNQLTRLPTSPDTILHSEQSELARYGLQDCSWLKYRALNQKDTSQAMAVFDRERLSELEKAFADLGFDGVYLSHPFPHRSHALPSLPIGSFLLPSAAGSPRPTLPPLSFRSVFLSVSARLAAPPHLFVLLSSSLHSPPPFPSALSYHPAPPTPSHLSSPSSSSLTSPPTNQHAFHSPP